MNGKGGASQLSTGSRKSKAKSGVRRITACMLNTINNKRLV